MMTSTPILKRARKRWEVGLYLALIVLAYSYQCVTVQISRVGTTQCKTPLLRRTAVRPGQRCIGRGEDSGSSEHVGRVLRLRGGANAEQDEQNEGSGRANAGGALDGKQLEAFDTVMKRRFFFGPSFYIHGGVSGLFDYGPTGCAVKKSIIAAWREHFVVEDGMLEVDCPSVTPEAVLAASGHVQRFTDLMVRDEQSGECFRADKLLEEFCSAALARLANLAMRAKELQKAAAMASAAWQMPAAAKAVVLAGGDEVKRRAALEQLRNAASSMVAADIDSTFRMFNITSPSTGLALSASFPFNLMFRTAIGPSGTSAGFMRPETAQGIFTNFKRLLEFNGGRLPMAVAQIGKAFRNEIAPKQGLLRLREFEMAEIEHFLPYNDTSHAGFEQVADLRIFLWSAAAQEAGEAAVATSIRQAVSRNIVSNQALPLIAL